MLDVLFDPQTSGGLLIAVAEADARRLVEALQSGYETRAQSEPATQSPVRTGLTEPGSDKTGLFAGAAIVGRAVQAGTGRIHVRTVNQRVLPGAPAGGLSGGTSMRRSPAAQEDEETAMSECCSGGHGGESAHPRADESGAATTVVPEIQKKFQEFLRTVNQPGALDAHTKQAICLALAVLAKCEPCVRSHIAKAREKGFTPAEIDEAAWLAISFGGAPLMMFYNGIRKDVL
jgi:AhpD family alkylhydroperoxidase